MHAIFTNTVLTGKSQAPFPLDYNILLYIQNIVLVTAGHMTVALRKEVKMQNWHLLLTLTEPTAKKYYSNQRLYKGHETRLDDVTL